VENICPSNITSCCQRNPSNDQPVSRTLKAIPIGTGLSSTLLSSQRTTTHRQNLPPS
jgi:hypothetical protein